MERDKMLNAYHGDTRIKDKYLARVAAHRAADELIKGVYWQKGKGCAVGCTIHSARHSRYETELGIPIGLARIEDAIFERLPNGQAMKWPERFLEAIPVGGDLRVPYWQWMRWLLKADEKADEKEGIRNLLSRLGIVYATLVVDGDERKAALDARDALDALAALAARDTRDTLDTLDTLAVLNASERLLALMAEAPLAG